MKNVSSRTAAWIALLGVIALAAGAMLMDGKDATAADHGDPPGRTASAPAEDIADLYAYTVGTGADQKLVLITTFGGLIAPGDGVKWDKDVLYGVHIDNSADALPDVDIFVRFGQNKAGEWGVQVNGLPGEDSPVVGPAGSEFTNGDADVKIQVGLFDDPFFFDLAGFQETLTSGDVKFDPTRDSLAGTNVGAIVIEMPIADALGTGSNLGVWATTAKIAATN